MQDQLASGSNEIPAELFCIVSSSNDFYRTVLVVYEKTEGRMRSLSKNNLPLFTFYAFSLLASVVRNIHIQCYCSALNLKCPIEQTGQFMPLWYCLRLLPDSHRHLQDMTDMIMVTTKTRYPWAQTGTLSRVTSSLPSTSSWELWSHLEIWLSYGCSYNVCMGNENE